MNQGKNLRLLIIEESSSRAESLAATLQRAGYDTDFKQARDVDSVRRLLDAGQPEIMLCGPGHGLPDITTLASLLPELSPGIALIAITPIAPQDGLVPAMQAGASIQIIHDQPDCLVLAVGNALETVRAQLRVTALENELIAAREQCQALAENPDNEGSIGLKEKIRALSKQDILTGLKNRQNFMQTLGTTLEDRTGEQETHGLIYLLLDGFKAIREDIGVVGSDMMLCDIAELIRKHCSPQDHIARFGDHAFTILRYNTNTKIIQKLAEKLRVCIADHTSEIEGRRIGTTCSIGVCATNEHTSSAQDILSRADLACEVAASSGGNRIHMHNAAVDEQMSDEHEQHWDEMVRNAIDAARFYLVYQPIVCLTGESGERYEVLLRILDENDHVILPGQFISIAEKTGMSGEIDRWVIDTALQSLADLQQSGRNASFFIKLSAPTLADLDLPRWIKRRVDELQLDSRDVVFEISERAATRDLRNTMMFTQAISNIPCKVAIEHYGPDGNQPTMLKHLSFDIVKIDSSLIDNLGSDKAHQSRVKSIVDNAHQLGKQCVAERVDDTSVLALLWQYGVEFIQGNFVQEPGRTLEYDFEGEIA